jgi:hypothetical protein
VKARAIIDDVDYSEDLMREGAQKLTIEIEDSEGNQNMGDLDMRFHDEEHELLGALDSQVPLPVRFSLAGNLMFEGFTEPLETESDWDSEEVAVKALPMERKILDDLAQRKIRDFAPPARLMGVKNTDSSSGIVSYNAWFFAIDEIFDSAIKPVCDCSVLIPGVTFSHYYIGGQSVISPYRIPDWTAKDLLLAFAALFNGVVHYSDGMLKIEAKKDLLGSSEAPIELPLIRDSLKANIANSGIDQVDFAFAGSDEDTSEATGSSVATEKEWFGGFRCGRTALPFAASNPLKRSSIFRYASTSSQGSSDAAAIPYSSDSAEYLVTCTLPRSALASVLASKRVTAKSVVNTWYSCELHGFPGWEADLLLMGSENLLPQLLVPYRRIRHPKGSGMKYFLRKAEIDRNEEIVHVCAMGYDV